MWEDTAVREQQTLRVDRHLIFFYTLSICIMVAKVQESSGSEEVAKVQESSGSEEVAKAQESSGSEEVAKAQESSGSEEVAKAQESSGSKDQGSKGPGIFWKRGSR